MSDEKLGMTIEVERAKITQALSRLALQKEETQDQIAGLQAQLKEFSAQMDRHRGALFTLVSLQNEAKKNIAADLALAKARQENQVK